MVITLTPNWIIIRIGRIGIHLARPVAIPHARIGDGIPIPPIDTIGTWIIVAIVIRPGIKIGSGIIPTGRLCPSGIVVRVGFRITVGSTEEVGGCGGGVPLIFAPVGGLGAGVIAVRTTGGGVVGVVSEHVVETCGGGTAAVSVGSGGG